MIDDLTQLAVVFLCAHEEMALLEEAFQASDDLIAGIAAGDPSPEFLAVFPPIDRNPWSGFRAIFDDPASPMLGASLEGGTTANDVTQSRAIILGHGIDVQAVAHLVHRCCAQTLSEGRIQFASATCSRLRFGDFDGGWYAIFSDRIDIDPVLERLDRALREN